MSARRRFVHGLVLGALGSGLSGARAAHAAPEGTAVEELLDGLELLSAGVVRRLRGLEARVAAARAFARSALADHERLAAERRALRRRLRLPAPVPPAASGGEPEPGLAGLRAAQQELVDAHVEALPELADPIAVDRLARHMAELARHLTVIDLWIQVEEQRG